MAQGHQPHPDIREWLIDDLEERLTGRFEDERVRFDRRKLRSLIAELVDAKARDWCGDFAEGNRDWLDEASGGDAEAADSMALDECYGNIFENDQPAMAAEIAEEYARRFRRSSPARARPPGGSGDTRRRPPRCRDPLRPMTCRSRRSGLPGGP